MPYGVGLKDERPTSNFQRPTSNEKTNIENMIFSLNMVGQAQNRLDFMRFVT
jgi:hypothetical protein